MPESGPGIERRTAMTGSESEPCRLDPRVFPYGVRPGYKNGTFRSWFCTEKLHSMTHWEDNYATVGRITGSS